MKGMFVILLLVVVFIAVGWVKNLIKLTDCDFQSPYKCEVVHTIGIVPVVGMITGWITIEE